MWLKTIYNGVETLIKNVGNAIAVSLETALSKDIDSIDVGKMSQSGVTTALNAVTATTTSDEIAVGAAGFKHIILEITGSAFSSGNFVIAIKGCSVSGGTFGDIYRIKEDGTYAKVSDITINSNTTVKYVIPFVCTAYLKITGTRTTDGTLTVKVTAFN